MACNNDKCNSDICTQVNPKRPVKRFTGAGSLMKKNLKIVNQIPVELFSDKLLASAIRNLPDNYNFEIYKTIHKIRTEGAKKVALQFPEGLLIYSLTISDIISTFCSSVEDVLVMGDVTYGACCIDDFTAMAVGCDFMIHYGHSCLIPVDITRIKTMYVFVDIGFDTDHFIETVQKNVSKDRKIALVATIQFVGSLQLCMQKLTGYDLFVPQARPLSKGEILGCTSPKLDGQDLIMCLLSNLDIWAMAGFIWNP
jgi:2-(3-amino-3-carboxypropyl)histidine synthase